MRTPAFRLAGLLILAVASGPAAFAQQWADELFPVKKHDFGSVARAARTEFRFPVENRSSQPVHIARVRASCGCTTPTIEDEWIEPGETGYIKARYNTDSFLGKKGATLTVVLDRPHYAEVQLRVDGYIRRDIVFDPGEVAFGAVEAGQPAEKTVKLAYAGRSDWQVTGVRCNLPYVTADAEETERGGGRVGYRVTVRLAEDAPEGTLHGALTLVTNDTRMTQVPLEMTAEVQPAVQVSPKSIALGAVKPGDVVEKRVVVRGPQPFRVTEIECEGFDVTIEGDDQPKAVHVLTVQLVALGSLAEERHPLVVRTDLPGQPTGAALVTATVRE